jgi:putative flippase GtrA
MSRSVPAAQATKSASLEFLRFLAAGGVAAAVNIASRWAFDHVMGYSAAIVLGYLCGMFTAFVLMKFLVFGASRLSTGSEAIRFAIVNLAAVVQVWGISVLLAEWAFPALGWIQHRYDIAHVIGVAVPVFTSYLGHKWFSFTPARDLPDASA